MGTVKIHDVVTFPGKFWTTEFQELFPEELINLLIHMHQKFNPRRLKLLEERRVRQSEYDAGKLPGFPDPSSVAASGNWKVGKIPSELLCRRVEITGPVNSAKMVINMLNRNEDGSRADMAMLDFEDSMKPSFENVLQGFKNVIGAVGGNLTAFVGDKKYQLNANDKAYVMVRSRGLHLNETNIKIHGEEISAGLLDLTSCFFHTARLYLAQNLTPKYYIPKCEHYLEARWWNDVFIELETKMGLPVPTLKATFLIETLPATYQVEEILYEIREHAAGLNVGRWDKIFSDIKVLKNHPDKVMADRGSITMEKSWMENYAKRVIKVCHDRGAFAMGGMAAFTPGKSPELRQEQRQKVLKDKKREALWGHDGCWVSHPYFIDVAMEAMTFENQLHRKIEFDKYSDILPKGDGPHSLEGLRTNIRVGIAYMHGWQKDIGCVAFDNLMEDLATLEISRAQTWQWLHHKILLDDGSRVSKGLIIQLFDEEYQKILIEMRAETPEKYHRQLEVELGRARDEAARIFIEEELRDFLTLASEPV
ncbi:MAG: malate synthase [Bacteriovoracia bacterium]